MGTVQAKSYPTGIEEEKMKDKGDNIYLEKVSARVDKINIDGVARTKQDVLAKSMKDLFGSQNFQEVILNIYSVADKLQKLNAFKRVDVFIDTSSGADATPKGLEVTFYVQEVRRITGGINTLVGNNEGSLVAGVQLPNMFGRGECLQSEYHYGTKRSSGFNVTFTKPFISRGNPRFTAALFKQGEDFTWSGFREIDHGTLLELNLESFPRIQHTFRWEGIWREIKSLSTVTSFPVREESGHSLKSSVKHTVALDLRDNPVIPTYGQLFKLHQEYAGLGGDVGFLKHELEVQLNQSLGMDMVLQASLLGGILNKIQNKNYSICDKFFLGGPLSLRGFTVRGVGPRANEDALGAETYWASGLHLYTPLPFRPGRDGIGNYFRTHTFLNAGNIGYFLGENNYPDWKRMFSNIRLSCGAGIVISVGHIARFELNYCLPLKFQNEDRTNPGMQFGIGVAFL
ncbi:sorting and assembly machinery component 50 homolog A [Centruroides vittatus]|uniref:sorting and assembly machinery component 50 homolog A n=1 Tax=Centruroides vittatus TaxID=120091 RepID=UPI00350FAB31